MPIYGHLSEIKHAVNCAIPMAITFAIDNMEMCEAKMDYIVDNIDCTCENLIKESK